MRRDMAYPPQYDSERWTWTDVARAAFALVVLVIVVALGLLIASLG